MKDNLQELFIVVDDQDHILGYRTRFDCHHDRSLIHRTAGVVVFDSTGRLLLQKRSVVKDLNPGIWGISTAGHVMKGETYEEAARREMSEEIGITVPITMLKKFLCASKEETEMATVFRADYNGPFQIAENEVAEVRFFTKQELLESMKTGAVKVTESSEYTLKQIGYL